MKGYEEFLKENEHHDDVKREKEILEILQRIPGISIDAFSLEEMKARLVTYSVTAHNHSSGRFISLEAAEEYWNLMCQIDLHWLSYPPEKEKFDKEARWISLNMLKHVLEKMKIPFDFSPIEKKLLPITRDSKFSI